MQRKKPLHLATGQRFFRYGASRLLASALEQLLATLGQMHHAQVLAGTLVAFTQGLQRGDGGVIDEAQVAAVQGYLLRVIGRLELRQEGGAGIG